MVRETAEVMKASILSRTNKTPEELAIEQNIAESRKANKPSAPQGLL